MFYFTLDHQQISSQVAALLNNHNQLSTRKSTSDILHSKIDYVVETHGKWVLGAIGLDRQSYTFTEIKHLVVHPEWRGQGLAKHLLKRALSVVGTKMVYATVREDNKASLKLFEGFGFRRSGDYYAGDHKVILLVRVSPQWEKIKSASESRWSTVETSVQELVSSTLMSLGRGSKMGRSG